MKCLLVLLAFVVCIYAQGSGFDIDKLGSQGKKFFMDMTKQAMGVPSFKPENLAAQAFFRTFLDKYTRLDENVKRDMMMHVPKVTKVLDAAAKKFNIDPQQSFQMLSTFFETFKQKGQAGLAQQGLKMVGNLLKNKNNQGQAKKMKYLAVFASLAVACYSMPLEGFQKSPADSFVIQMTTDAFNMGSCSARNEMHQNMIDETIKNFMALDDYNKHAIAYVAPLEGGSVAQFLQDTTDRNIFPDQGELYAFLCNVFDGIREGQKKNLVESGYSADLNGYNQEIAEAFSS